MVCALELQINAYWATRTSHFLMINARTLRDTQQMTQKTLGAISLAMQEGNPSPISANTEELSEIVSELRQLMQEGYGGAAQETPIHGYVWLSLELARQLEMMSAHLPRAAQVASDKAGFTMLVSIQQHLRLR